MTAVDPEGRIRHPLDVFHSTLTPTGAAVPAGMIPVADGLGQVEYVDRGDIAGEGSIPLTIFDEHDVPHGYHLTKQGLVLSPSGSGWKQARVESPNVFWDPVIGKYRLVFVGYTGTVGAEGHAALGYMTADTPDGPWTEYGSNPFFSGSGSGADLDGCTGPFVWYEDGTYHLYYIGLTASGLEGGTKSICHATSTDFSSWTRHGAIITPSGSGWRNTAVWHPDVVKRNGTYYLFFNADGATETIGYATSTDLTTWTVDDVNSPVLSTGAGGTWDDTIVNDPAVYRIGETWYMAYGGWDGSSFVKNGLAYTSDADFPLGWTKYASNPVLTVGAGGSFDEQGAGRPAVWITGTRYYLWYSTQSAANVTAFALATEDLPASSAPSGAAGGDLSGTYPNPTVNKVEGVDVSSTPPSTGQVLTATSSSAASWQTVTGGQHILLADGHATPFTFNDLLQMDDGSDFMWSDPA